MFDVEKIRKDFPVLQQEVYGNPLIYLDNGSTSQKPSAVIEKISSFYSHRNSSIHRGIHFLSEQATVEYESARNRVKEFINAEQNREIIFTAGTTASINSVAFSFGEKYIKQEMRSSSQKWNIMPILYPGKCFVTGKDVS